MTDKISIDEIEEMYGHNDVIGDEILALCKLARCTKDLLSRHSPHHESGNIVVEAGYFNRTKKELSAFDFGGGDDN